MEERAKKVLALKKKQESAISRFQAGNFGEAEWQGHLKDLLQELRTYQVELELQNEELRVTQQELLSSREKYFDLYNYAPAGYVTVSENGLILDANLTFAEMLGLDRQTLIKKPLTSFIVMAHQDIFYRYFRKRTDGEIKIKTIAVQMKRPDNSEIWVRLSAALEQPEAQAPTTQRFIIADIDELKHAEELLQESEKRLRLTLDATSDGFFDRDLRSGDIYYGENWAKTLGYSRDEVERLKISWGDLLHPDDKESALASVRAHLAGETSAYNNEFRMRHKNGEWKWIQARGQVVEWDADNKPLRFVGTHVDITEKKTIAERLQENERRFRTLAELSPAGIYLTDPKGNCLYVNRCWQETAGLTMQEARGQGWLNGVHPDDQQRVMSAWQEMISSGSELAIDYRFLTRDGKTTWVYALAKSIPGANGWCDGYVGINTDISAIKQAEVELQFAFAELEVLVKERSQELNESYKKLQHELQKRIETEQALRKSEGQLEREKMNLEEINIALRVLLKKGEEEKGKLEEQMMLNARQLIAPYIEKMKKDSLTPGQKTNLSVIETNLKKLTSPFLRKISTLSLHLSPMEIKVAHFVKEGASTKEIAQRLNLSTETISIHRKNIRKKIGVSGKKSNLRSILMSVDNQ